MFSLTLKHSKKQTPIVNSSSDFVLLDRTAIAGYPEEKEEEEKQQQQQKLQTLDMDTASEMGASPMNQLTVLEKAFADKTASNLKIASDTVLATDRLNKTVQDNGRRAQVERDFQLSAKVFSAFASTLPSVRADQGDRSWTDKALYRWAKESVQKFGSGEAALQAGSRVIVLDANVSISSDDVNGMSPARLHCIEKVTNLAVNDKMPLEAAVDHLKFSFVPGTMTHPGLGVLTQEEFAQRYNAFDPSAFIVLAATAWNFCGFENVGCNLVGMKHCQDTDTVDQSKIVQIPPRGTKADKGCLWYIDPRLSQAQGELESRHGDCHVYGCHTKDTEVAQTDLEASLSSSVSSASTSVGSPSSALSIKERAKKMIENDDTYRNLARAVQFAKTEVSQNWVRVADPTSPDQFTLSVKMLQEKINDAESARMVVSKEIAELTMLIDSRKVDNRPLEDLPSKLSAAEVKAASYEKMAQKFKDYESEFDAFVDVFNAYIDIVEKETDRKFQRPIKFTVPLWKTVIATMVSSMEKIAAASEQEIAKSILEAPSDYVVSAELAQMAKQQHQPFVARELCDLSRFFVAPSTVPLQNIDEVASLLSFSKLFLNLGKDKPSDNCSCKLSFVLLRVPVDSCGSSKNC